MLIRIIVRIAAGRALNSWLISKAGATGEKKADQVAVVEFSDDATLIYPLGDPEGANASFSDISLTGGTYISSGVQMGMGQVNASSTGTTNGRSSIIVFTDGEDEDPAQLVRSINQATAQGIRVSFGFLDSTASVQDAEILTAITGSGGVYATITSEDASNNFINFAILNGRKSRLLVSFRRIPAATFICIRCMSQDQVFQTCSNMTF